MRFLKTYEEFKFDDKDAEVLEPKTKRELIDRPVDDTLLGGKKEDSEKDSESTDYVNHIDSKGVIHLKDFKVY